MKAKISELSLLLVFSVAGYATADTWDNSVQNSSWGTNNNWADNTQPTLSDPAIFPTPIPFGLSTIVLSLGEVASSLTFNDNYTFSLSGNLLHI